MKAVYQKRSLDESETLEVTAETTEDSEQLQILTDEYIAWIAKKARKDDQTPAKMLEVRPRMLEATKNHYTNQ